MLEILGIAVTQITVNEHQTKSPGAKNEADIINYPVIFIKGFMSRERAKNDYIYDLIATWAAQMAENHLAHVVFVSNNPGNLHSLFFIAY